MDSADSALKSALLTLTSPQVLAALLAIIAATLVALVVARALRARRLRDAAADLPLPAHWLDHALEGAVLLAPFLAALVTLLAAHAVITVLAVSSAVVDAALRLVAVLALLRLGVFVLGLLLGPGSWVRARGARITLILWAVAAVAMLGWLDLIESSLNRISLVPGRTQFSLWALLKGLVVVTAFVVVASLIARALERHVMRLDQLAVSTRVGVSKFANFLLVGLGILLGINAAGVDVTTLNVLTGAIGIGLGFGLQSVASNFVSGFVLLIDKSIKPGDVISFTGHTGASTEQLRLGAGAARPLRRGARPRRGRHAGAQPEPHHQSVHQLELLGPARASEAAGDVSYDDDPELALKLLVEAAANHPRILRDPPAVSRLISFEDNGIRLEIRFWIADPVNGVNNVRSDVNRAIWRIFRAHGVTMPSPQREVRILEGSRRPLPVPLAPPAPGRDQSAD